VLRYDERIAMSLIRDALLAGNQNRVLLNPVPFLVVHDDVVPLDVVLDRCEPGDEARAFPGRAVEAHRDVERDALSAHAARISPALAARIALVPRRAGIAVVAGSGHRRVLAGGMTAVPGARIVIVTLV